MSPAALFGSRYAMMSLVEDGEGGQVAFHHATLPLDASTASLRELYNATQANAAAVASDAQDYDGYEHGHMDATTSVDDHVHCCADNFGTMAFTFCSISDSFALIVDLL